MRTATLILTALSTLGVQAQQPSAPPRFEVASVKENKTNDGITVIQTQKGRFTAKLEAANAMVPVLVIDSAVLPTPN